MIEAPLIDENAFGLLISYFHVEDDEYSCEPREFVERFRAFEREALAVLSSEALSSPLPAGRRSLCLGHCVYTEFADLEHHPDLLTTVRQVAGGMSRTDFESVVVLTHGGRWVSERHERPCEVTVEGGEVEVVRLSAPSEPLRRALQAETMARSEDDEAGWGPGLYVDTEALEALGKRPKNAPTVLSAKGAEFFRISGLAPAE